MSGITNQDNFVDKFPTQIKQLLVLLPLLLATTIMMKQTCIEMVSVN